MAQDKQSSNTDKIDHASSLQGLPQKDGAQNKPKTAPGEDYLNDDHQKKPSLLHRHPSLHRPFRSEEQFLVNLAQFIFERCCCCRYECRKISARCYHGIKAHIPRRIRFFLTVMRATSDNSQPSRWKWCWRGGRNDSNGPENSFPELDLENNENYAKYGKKGFVTNKRPKHDILLLGVATFSFMLGFSCFLFSHPLASSNVPPTLPHQPNSQNVLKRSSLSRKTKDDSKKLEPEPNPLADTSNLSKLLSDLQTHDPTRLPILIPRFDNRKYLRLWEQQALNTSLSENPQSNSQANELGGWTFPAAFRPFPVARDILGPIKSSFDFSEVADYGRIDFKSIRDKKVLARTIPEDDVDFLVPWAFEPSKINPENPRANKKRGAVGNHKIHPNYRTRTTKSNNLTFEDLRAMYDDDSVHFSSATNDGEKRARACQSVAWEYSYFPNCNSFHELDVGRVFDDPVEILTPRPEMSTVSVKYLSHGYYRDVWIAEEASWLWSSRPMENNHTSHYGVNDEEETANLVSKAFRSAALKTLRWSQDMDDDNFEMVQAEAIVMERLTKSPRIIDIYGHCGFSVSVEVVPIEFEEVVIFGEGYASQEEIHQRNLKGVVPFNNFTATEKLGFALEMAESLADLHGFEDGVIVHDDVQLCQWLHTVDGRLKLGDFNRATIMQWDIENEEYCKFNNGQAYGNYRSPEEFAIKDLDEKIDVFSFGNNIYALLTGLWNFYDTDDDDKVHEKLINRQVPFLDPRYKERSFAEMKLADIMEKCWQYDPDDRISIFDARELLREAVRENSKLVGPRS